MSTDADVKGNLVSRRKPARYIEIGVRIGNLRREWSARTGRKLRQEDLAEEIGVDLSTVTAWETGRQRPMGDNLGKLADFFQVPAHEITGEQEASAGLRVAESGSVYDVNQKRTVQQLREAASNGRLDLAAELARINALPIEEWRKDMKIAQLEALTRAEAMSADARAREADARAADQRARAARVAALSDLSRTRFLSRVEDAAIREAALRRAEELRRQAEEEQDRSGEGTG